VGHRGFASLSQGHFTLSLGLHDALAPAGKARIVSLSSSGHLASPVVFVDNHFERRPPRSLGCVRTSEKQRIGRRYLEDANEARIIANDAEPGALTVGAGVREWALDPAAAAQLWDVSLAMLALAQTR
jgi:hypothetical protein